MQSTSSGAVWVNFDETPLWFCQRTGKTHISKKRVRGGEPVRLVGDPSLSRKRITVGLAISTDPTLAAEIPTFAIFHGEQDRRPNSDAWRHVDVPDGVALHWQKSAWMTEELLGDWVGLLAQARDRVFGREQVVVLVWDSFRAHLTDAIKILCSEYKLRVVVVPRGLTSILQGLDTHVNKSFKAACRAWWRRFLFDAEDPREGALGYQDLLHMIRDSASGVRLISPQWFDERVGRFGGRPHQHPAPSCGRGPAQGFALHCSRASYWSRGRWCSPCIGGRTPGGRRRDGGRRGGGRWRPGLRLRVV